MSRGARLLGPLALLCAGWALTAAVWPWSDRSVTDIFVYQRYAQLMADGALPFRDFTFEYPPLAAPVLALGGVLGTSDAAVYEATFGVLMLLAAAACLALVSRLAALTGGRPARAAYALALLPLATGALAREHFDLVPVALALAGLALVAGGRRTSLGFAVLGLGAATKAFPLLVALPALAWLVGRGERRAALRGAAALTAVVLALGGATYALSPAGARYAWSYQVERPVQVESAPAVVMRALDAAGVAGARRVAARNGDALEGPASGPVTAVSTAILLVALAGFALLAARAPSRRALVLAALGSVAAAAAFGKVLSPQFLIWTWPLAALALAWGELRVAALGAAAAVLTFLEFPFRYHDVAAGAGGAVLLVAVRDLALAGCVAAALSSLALGRQDDLLHRARPSVVAGLDQHAVEPDVLVGGLEADRHQGAEAL